VLSDLRIRIFIPLDCLLDLQTILLVVLVLQQQLAPLAASTFCVHDTDNLVLYL
jgi:hypothetical protein